MSRSADDRLAKRLQRSLQRRIDVFKRRWEWNEADESECDDRTPLEFVVEDVALMKGALDSSSETVHRIPTWMIPTVSSPLSIALPSLHPSREFANAHLEAKSADQVDQQTQSSSYWLECRSWTINNYSSDHPPMELSDVRLCCAENDRDTDESVERNISFSRTIFQSIRLPSDFTLQHCLHYDEQASQIAFHAAEQEQQELRALDQTSKVRDVAEHEYQRFEERIMWKDESSPASTSSNSSGFTPLSPSFIPILAAVLHRYGLPLSLHTSSLLHAIAGFEFLQGLLSRSPAVDAILQCTVFDTAFCASVCTQLEQRIHELLWGDMPKDAAELILSTHTRTVDPPSTLPLDSTAADDADEDVPPPSSSSSAGVDDLLRSAATAAAGHQEAQSRSQNAAEEAMRLKLLQKGKKGAPVEVPVALVTPPASNSKFARMALDAVSFIDDSKTAISGDQEIEREDADAPASSSTSDTSSKFISASTVPALVVSFLDASERALEIYLTQQAEEKSLGSKQAGKKGNAKVKGKGKGKR